jgi:hypothetical protein
MNVLQGASNVDLRYATVSHVHGDQYIINNAGADFHIYSVFGPPTTILPQIITVRRFFNGFVLRTPNPTMTLRVASDANPRGVGFLVATNSRIGRGD